MTLFPYRNANYISLDQIPYLIKTQQLLIDIRSKEQYDNFHIPGFINIQEDNLQHYVSNLKDKSFYLLCQSGIRSARVADELCNQGYLAYSFIGGIQHYNLDTHQYF